MMKSSIATSSLLLALAAGLAGPVCAADESSPALAPDPCAASSREIAAVAAHLRDARAQRTGTSAQTATPCMRICPLRAPSVRRQACC